ncbi:hypothetical protein BD310DRAFT_930075 [Dichomitus squalens]|uniref:Uncharacterized protein n=1 Tax=Dichomitus squalens TaxID=114155 RepID=A0A4V2K7R4_9APHY|nr:hypothetical protein BD310DRAFT_930075 [Dichomitus squalens]
MEMKKARVGSVGVALSPACSIAVAYIYPSSHPPSPHPRLYSYILHVALVPCMVGLLSDSPSVVVACIQLSIPHLIPFPHPCISPSHLELMIPLCTSLSLCASDLAAAFVCPSHSPIPFEFLAIHASDSPFCRFWTISVSFVRILRQSCTVIPLLSILSIALELIRCSQQQHYLFSPQKSMLLSYRYSM